MEINSASFGGHVVADLAVKAEIDANWDPPGTYGLQYVQSQDCPC